MEELAGKKMDIFVIDSTLIEESSWFRQGEEKEKKNKCHQSDH